MTTRLRTVAFWIALTSCASFGPPLYLPDQGPTGWTQLATEHFVLCTDLSLDLAQERIQRLEVLRSVLEDIAFPSSKQSRQGPVTVIVFRRARDYQALAPFGTAGVTFPDESSEEEPAMILVSAELTQQTDSRDNMPPQFDMCPSRASMSPSCWSSPRSEFVTEEEVDQTLVHEVVHALIHRSFDAAPPWLDEGLAQYLSTMRLEEGSAILGNPIPTAAEVPSSLLPSVRELTLAEPSRFHARAIDSVTAARYYAGAWVLVHLFENGPETYGARFRVFANALKDGKRSDDAWRGAMAGLDDATLQADYVAHARTSAGQLVERRVAPPPRSSTKARAMSAADVRSLWATARRRLGDGPP